MNPESVSSISNIFQIITGAIWLGWIIRWLFINPYTIHKNDGDTRVVQPRKLALWHLAFIVPFTILLLINLFIDYSTNTGDILFEIAYYATMLLPFPYFFVTLRMSKKIGPRLSWLVTLAPFIIVTISFIFISLYGPCMGACSPARL